MLTYSQADKLTDFGPKDTRWFRVHMPYCIRVLNEGSRLWLPLNRDYKPLGVRSEKWVKYEDYADQAMKFSRDPRTFKDVWDGDGRSDTLYLYMDNPKSRMDYFERFERLMTYSVRCAEPKAK